MTEQTMIGGMIVVHQMHSYTLISHTHFFCSTFSCFNLHLVSLHFSSYFYLANFSILNSLCKKNYSLNASSAMEEVTTTSCHCYESSILKWGDSSSVECNEKKLSQSLLALSVSSLWCQWSNFSKYINRVWAVINV